MRVWARFTRRSGMDLLGSSQWTPPPPHASCATDSPASSVDFVGSPRAADDGPACGFSHGTSHAHAPIASSAFGSLIVGGHDQSQETGEMLALGEIPDEEPTGTSVSMASSTQPLQVHLFPTYGTQHTCGSWRVNVHGWVFDAPAAARLDPGQRWFGHRFSRNLICRARALFASRLFIQR